MKSRILFGLSTTFLLLTAYAPTPKRATPKTGYRDWKVYGGTADGIRYSALTQINRRNVSQLQVAWTFDTGDSSPNSQMQCNPIVIDGFLYATSPKLRVFALDATTGAQRWVFDPWEGSQFFNKQRSRGLTYWRNGDEGRIYVVARHYLFALDARTGQLVKEFGLSGRVDLREGFGRDPAGMTITATTPGVVYRDLLILGNVSGESLPAAPGDIRAYDLRSGKLRWSFHTIPHPGEFGYETWPPDAWKYSGAANNWAGMAVDEKRGLVFVPTGSAAFDFYGANRLGDNLFANSLLALKAETGKGSGTSRPSSTISGIAIFRHRRRLVTVRRGGRLIDAVAQITKSGHVFVFERETGQSLFPIEYRPVAQSDVDGEKVAQTQPLPLKPAPFARQTLTESMLTRRSPAAYDAVLTKLRAVRNSGPFDPPSLQGTIVFPGFDGGGEWGGAAFDPETGLLYVNSNEMAWILRLVEKAPPKARPSGRNLYLQQCASCHRDNREGTPPEFPSLVGIGEKYSTSDIVRITLEGGGRMPGFVRLRGEPARAIADYLVSGNDSIAEKNPEPSPMDLKYRHDGYNKFLDPDGYPALEPPWGTLNAISLDSGDYVWKIPFGEFPELVDKGIRNTGTENYGGPVVTAGGLLFIGATNYDRKFHAFDKATGKLLWETILPASGNATPAVYEANGRQFIVIAAGGGRGSASGGAYVAFALPEDGSNHRDAKTAATAR